MELLDLKPSRTQDYSSVNDLISIKKTIEKNVSKGANASFVSTTKRITDKPSNVPGPGSYNAKFDHKFHKNIYDSFGSTSERKTDFNRSINLPFTDPTYMENPPVGHYSFKPGAKDRKKVKSISPIRHTNIIK